MKPVWSVTFILIGTFGFAQTSSESFPPMATMKQVMVDHQ